MINCCLPLSTFGLERHRNSVRCVWACCRGNVVQNYEFCHEKKKTKKTKGFISIHPESFGGLDAVYRAVKEKQVNVMTRKLVQAWLSQAVSVDILSFSRCLVVFSKYICFLSIKTKQGQQLVKAFVRFFCEDICVRYSRSERTSSGRGSEMNSSKPSDNKCKYFKPISHYCSVGRSSICFYGFL